MTAPHAAQARGQTVPARRPNFVYWRRGFLGLAFVTGLMQATFFLRWIVTRVLENPPPTEVAWVIGIAFGVTLLLMPFFIVAVITLQKINPFVDDVWERPTADSNPFYLVNPLLPIDFAAKIAVAWGLGYAVCTPWSGLAALLFGAVAIVGGLEVFLAVRWAIRDTCRDRIADADRKATAEASEVGGHKADSMPAAGPHPRKTGRTRHRAMIAIRRGIYVATFFVFFAQTVFIPPGAIGQAPALFQTARYMMVFIGGPFMFMAALAVIGFQAKNPFSADVWGRPAADSNPLCLSNPLLFVDFAARTLLAIGAALILASPWSGRAALIQGLGTLWAALGLLLAVHVSINHTCRHKLADPSPRPEGAGQDQASQ